MKWTDNLVLEGEWDDLKERGQWQLAMYALHLSSGNSIYCKQIRATTIEQYVFAAASYMALFSGHDYRKDSPNDRSMGHILAPVYKDLKKYETIPNRREPYTVEMHRRVRVIVDGVHPDALPQALADGFEKGMSTGFRLTEWAQPAGCWDVSKPCTHPAGGDCATRALVPNDYRVQTYNLQ